MKKMRRRYDREFKISSSGMQPRRSSRPSLSTGLQETSERSCPSLPRPPHLQRCRAGRIRGATVWNAILLDRIPAIHPRRQAASLPPPISSWAGEQILALRLYLRLNPQDCQNSSYVSWLLISSSTHELIKWTFALARGRMLKKSCKYELPNYLSLQCSEWRKMGGPNFSNSMSAIIIN